MKKIMLLVLAVAAAFTSKASPCDCGFALDYSIKKLETNYSGFRDKVNEGNKQKYEFLVDSLTKISKLPSYQNQDSCLLVIRKYISFLRDGHVGINITGTGTVNPDSIRAKFANWPVVAMTREQFYSYLSNKNKLQPFEGAWVNEDGNYTVGVWWNGTKYQGFILKADSIYWRPGQVKFEAATAGEKTEGTFYMRDHTAEKAEFNLKSADKGVVEIGQRGKWYKLNENGKPMIKDFYPGASIVNFKQLSAATNLLTIRTFDETYRKLIDSIVTANDQLIRNTPNLIIDVRGNGGGSDVSYYPLRKYLFTNPYARYSAEILATNDNIQKFRELTSNPNFTKEEQERFKKQVESMEKSLNTFWSSSKAVSFMSDTLEELPNPKKVAVIMDKGCGSTTEQFLLDPVSNSKKATMYGQPSGGVLDYANIYFFIIPNTTLRVHYATSRSKRVDIGKGIDNKGIPPHVLLDASVKDWVKYVQEDIEKK